MGIEADTIAGVDGVLGEAWVITNGTVVPETEDVALKNGGRRIDATYLYADLAKSSWLAQNVKDEIAAKVIRAYLNAAVRILRFQNGHIRSFDGDRVMAIFIGSSKNTSAAKAAYAINWAVREVLRPKLAGKWPTSLASYEISHGVGIDTGTALVVRGGVRNHNDLVSVGSAPNVAAKLSDLRSSADIYISSGVYAMLHESAKVRLDGESKIWSTHPAQTVGGKQIAVYSTSYWRKPGS